MLSSLLGWGSDGSVLATQLQEATVFLVNRAECQKNYTQTISEAMICAAAPATDACQVGMMCHGNPTQLSVMLHYYRIVERRSHVYGVNCFLS